ncbi:MAG: hypothetical protein K2H64_02410 [Desulfovibrio sp.]|nr:hypothetical protein [Desulfovibrio sp.]
MFFLSERKDQAKKRATLCRSPLQFPIHQLPSIEEFHTYNNEARRNHSIFQSSYLFSRLEGGSKIIPEMLIPVLPFIGFREHFHFIIIITIKLEGVKGANPFNRMTKCVCYVPLRIIPARRIMILDSNILRTIHGVDHRDRNRLPRQGIMVFAVGGLAKHGAFKKATRVRVKLSKIYWTGNANRVRRVYSRNEILDAVIYRTFAIRTPIFALAGETAAEAVEDKIVQSIH